MKLNMLLALILIICIQLHGAERPPQPPANKKLPTFGQMIDQEEKRQRDETRRQALTRSSQAALIHVRNANPASLQGLPADIQAILLPYLTSTGPLNIKAITNTILALSGTSKALHAAMNEPRTLLAIFNALPYTANAVDLAERLQRKPNTMPGMQRPEMQRWLKSARESLTLGNKLERAVFDGNLKNVEEFLRNMHIDLNYPHNICQTVLMNAAERGKTEIVRLLLSAGANIDKQRALGETALIEASKNGHAEIVHLLIKAGASLNIQDIYGQTALWNAALYAYPEIVQLLLAANANPNLQGYDGETALTLAVIQPFSSKEKEYMVIVAQLLAAGADPNIKNKERQTAHDLALEKGNLYIAEILSKASAKRKALQERK